MHLLSSFITLTYDPAELPWDNSLDVVHWQKFAKRLRKKIGPFRFYHCGEYGLPEKGDQVNVHGRPHYHAIIFGEDFSFDRIKHKKTDRGDQLYVSETLTKVWGKGHAYIGEVTHESAAYVARYCMKKISGDQAGDHYEHVNTESGLVTDLKPEYATMSRRPGLGKTWLDKFRTDVYPHDYVVGQDGSQSRPPRYYDALHDKCNPASMASIKETRAKEAIKHKWNNTSKRLKVREKVQRAKLNIQRHKKNI